MTGTPFVKRTAGMDLEQTFLAMGGEAYELALSEAGQAFVKIGIDRLRRESGALTGEATVWCAIAGASVTNGGILSVADLNLSSQRARTERATYLATRAKAPEIDWRGLLDEFAVRVLEAERRGDPAVMLSEVPKQPRDPGLEHLGFVVPTRHSSILFGDGATAKSFFALSFLGALSKRGMKVALFDWELDATDHRDRLEMIFGEKMPEIVYARCERPITYEMDRLKRICRENRIDYACYDSVAFGCGGAPESAEEANKYLRAVRQIGTPSLLIAHVTKGGDDQKPFGSIFWHNGVRATWFCRIAEQGENGSIRQVGLFSRKANLSGMKPATAIEIRFGEDSWEARRIPMEDAPELHSSLSITKRVTLTLTRGAMTRTDIMDELSDLKRDAVKRAINRAVKSGFLRNMPEKGRGFVGLSV